MMMPKLNLLPAAAVITGFIVLTSSVSALAGSATDAIKQTHEEVLRILHDQQLKDPMRDLERQQQLALHIAQRFGCREMSRHLLGQHWNPLEEKEREEFVRLFLLILVKSYADYIERYAGQPLQYLDERLDNRRAVVRTRLIGQSGDLFMDFWLFERASDWQVYDVVVDGISLIENYRVQFQRLLRISSYRNLVQRMQQKVCPQSCAEPRLQENFSDK